MKIIKNLKSFFKLTLIYIFIFELIFQVCFFFNFELIKKPDLYYNGFCDQKYWNLIDKKISYKKNTKYHPILSIVKKESSIPEKFNDESYYNQNLNTNKKNEIAIYGSSYHNHVEFVNLLKNENIVFKNYSLESYGLDQIFLSYKLTAHQNKDKTILIGFLLEDLDRSVFSKREYEKASFILQNKNFQLSNVPINEKKSSGLNIDFYLLRFFQNFYNLIVNDFDPRKSKCKISQKKDLFIFFINEIEKLSLVHDQKIIITTYNLKEDLINQPTWRYKFIRDYLKKKKIIHIDAYKILKEKSINNNEKIKSYFGKDAHNNELSFSYIFEKIKKEL